MGDFLEDFQTAFPQYPDLENFRFLDTGSNLRYLDVRHLPVLARLDSPAAAISRARSVSRLGPYITAEGGALVESLVAVADAVLVSGIDVPAQTRALVELLNSALVDFPVAERLLKAHAAVIHARAGDRTLAQFRINEYQSLPSEFSAVTGWYSDTHRQDRLVELARVLLGVDPGEAPAIRTEDPGAGYVPHEFDDLIWDWLTQLSPDLPDRMVSEVVSQVALREPGRAFGSLVAGLATIPRVVGLTPEMAARSAPLLAQTEELLWLNTGQRAVLWSRLALAAASVDDADLAGRGITEAFDAERSGRLRDEELLDWAANLLNAHALLNTPVVAGPGPATVAEASAEPHASEEHAPSPLIEEGMAERLRFTLTAGTVLLVAGPELPSVRGAVGRADLLRSIAQRSDDQPDGRPGARKALEAITAGNFDLAARLLRAGEEDLEASIAREYAKPPQTSMYDEIARIPFTGVINLSWDRALLDAFQHRAPIVLHVGSDDVLAAAKSQEFVFTWYAGDPAAERIAISPREIRTRLQANETLSRFLTGAVQSSTLLFLGVRASDILDFFEAVPLTSSAPKSQVEHYAVCAVDELWELNRSELQTYGVELIGYDPADPEALSRITQHICDLGDPSGTGLGQPPRWPEPVDGPMLSRVVLTNIGAFEQLDLELRSGWNLLLGNNGVGKSTVLRAIALGLCGDHPSAIEAGKGLLRSGCDTGVIELQVGPSRFRTELHRSTDAVRVRTTSLTPLQQGNWAVLGFPSLRGMSLATPTGISSTQVPEPRVEDLLPLLRDDVDHRLDDVKQWIINIEARARQSGDQRSRRLLEQFFEVVSALTPGATLAYEAVDQVSWQVWVRTDDGVISIDQLSQGMNSILAWVGTLLQRMYDIYQGRDDPAAESAFVLIDELDAHLHPVWQRLLPSLIREHFPKVQCLATSHSPLMASSLRPGELFVATREPGPSIDGVVRSVVTITAVDVDPRGLRADQILTSPLFGLLTSRSPEFGQRVDRYSELMIAESRTPNEEHEMQRLKSSIATSYRDGETEGQREAEAREDIDLEDALSDVELSAENVAALRNLADSLGTAEDASQS